MKKSILFIILLLVSGIMYGQLKFGPKIGYNASRLTTSLDSITTEYKSGFLFGAFVRIGDRFYLQPELCYSTHGGILLKDSLGYYWKQDIHIGCLDIPVLAGFRIINTNLLNIRAFAGPVLSFVLNKKVTGSGDLTGPIQKSDISSTNWYIQAGAGMDIWMLTLDIRYQIGLNKIINEVQYNSGTVNFNSSNKVWVISLGLKI
jgi:hypothetical protein